MNDQKIVGLFSIDAKGELCFHHGKATAERAASLCASLNENVTGGPYRAMVAIAATIVGVTTVPAPLEIIGWQWRRIGQPWPEKLLNFEPSVTTDDSEKRAVYAGPVIPYGVKTCDGGQRNG